jgi:DNA polymerase III subunit alpha
MSETLLENRLVDTWFTNNQINAEWLTPQTFFLDGVRYLYLRPKQDGTISPQFTVALDPDELGEFMDHQDKGKVGRYCFEFGGKVYWSPITDGKMQLNLFKHIGTSRSDVGFAYLGVHGGFELCGGSRPYEAWCTKAKFLQIDTLAICEANTLAGALKFQMACDDNDIKSIIGETITVRSDTNEYKIKLYVADAIGWGNLLRIHKSVVVDNEGFTSPQELCARSAGLYCVFQHDTLIDESFGDYLDAAFQGLYFQFDPAQYKAVNRDVDCLNCLKAALDLNFPLALICDSYYLDQEDSRVRNILQFAGNTGFTYQSEDQYFKSLEQIVDQAVDMFTTRGGEFAMDVLDQALQGTKEISEGCTFEIELGNIRLPEYQLSDKELSSYKDSTDLFWGLIEEGLSTKIINKGKDPDQYLSRIDVEYDVISRGGFVDYFLILSDVTRWAKEQGILVGIGRGSGAGSLIAYLLDLVKVNPLDYGLLFERFLNEGRIGRSLPDLDTDFAGNRRGEVKRYIEERYGINNVCSIGTYGTFKLKAAFRDLCRHKGIEPQVLNYFASMIGESSDELHTLFYDAAETPALKTFINENSDVINDIDLILGQPKNASVHAAGVVITPNVQGLEIYDYMPIKLIDGILISEWEGPELEAAGFLKEDILGIRQLDKFSDIFVLIDQNHEKGHPEFEEVDYNDENVLDLFRKGWNQDLFHFGSKGLTAYSQDVKPDSMEELIAMIALYRPGAMEFGAHEDYVKIKRGLKEPEYDYMLEEITRPTYGLYCYQEQIMQACQVLGGFNLTQADDIRKAMGKKILSKLQGFKAKFLEGALSKGCPEYEANQIWSKLEAFAGYGFNKSHAAAYAMTGYFCQYLKYYYPMEFWTVSLQYAAEDEISQRISEIRKFKGIKVMPPDINRSQQQFTSDFATNTIYWSLGKIKFAGDAAVGEIMQEREKNGQFFDIDEFTSRIDKRKVNKRVVCNLIFAGCFDELYSVETPYQRRVILKQFLKEEFPSEYNTTDLFFWFVKQKEISQSGYFDYSHAVANSEISKAPDRFVTPDRILLMDNVDKVVVVAGLLMEVIVRKSKKGPFAQLILDHNNERIEVTLWNDSWVKYQQQLDQSINRGVIILGRVVGANRHKKYNTIHSFDDTVIEIF